MDQPPWNYQGESTIMNSVPVPDCPARSLGMKTSFLSSLGILTLILTWEPWTGPMLHPEEVHLAALAGIAFPDSWNSRLKERPTVHHSASTSLLHTHVQGCTGTYCLLSPSPILLSDPWRTSRLISASAAPTAGRCHGL